MKVISPPVYFSEDFFGKRAVFENQPLLKRGREKDGIIPSGGPESSVREAGGEEGTKGRQLDYRHDFGFDSLDGVQNRQGGI